MSTHVDDQLFELALDTLPADERAAVMAHVDGCAHCGAELAAVREAVAALPSALPSLEPAPASRERLLAQVSPRPAPARFARFVDEVARLLDVVRDRAGEILAAVDDETVWTPGFTDGMQLYHVRGGPATRGVICGIVRMDDGVRFPEHKHLGDEQVLILAGACRDDDGTIYGAGELVAKPAGSSHSFDAVGDLVYLAVLRDGLQVGDQVLLPDDPRA